MLQQLTPEQCKAILESNAKNPIVITKEALTCLVNNYQSSSRFWATPGPELKALKALIGKKQGYFTKAEIQQTIATCSSSPETLRGL